MHLQYPSVKTFYDKFVFLSQKRHLATITTGINMLRRPASYKIETYSSKLLKYINVMFKAKIYI